MKKCPVCDNELVAADLPRNDIFFCEDCLEIVHETAAGVLIPIGGMLDKHALGDDRVRAAISQPTVVSVKSFIEIYENVTRLMQIDLAAAAGGLRTLLSMLENRIDRALSCFTGMDLVSDEAHQGLQALRDARAMVSSYRRQGLSMEEIDGATSE